MPQMPVPLDVEPTPQRYVLHPVDVGGERGALLVVNMPMGVFAVTFQREAGLKLADELRAVFGALTIATEIPPASNGQRPPVPPGAPT